MNYINELIKVYSNQTSFFSKKRIESGVSFALGQVGMITYLVMNYDTLTISDITFWATLQFAISGYMINQIQKQKSKRDDTSDLKDSNEI